VSTQFRTEHGIRGRHWVIAVSLWLSALVLAALPLCAGLQISAPVEHWPAELNSMPSASWPCCIRPDPAHHLITYQLFSKPWFIYPEITREQVGAARRLSRSAEFQQAIDSLLQQQSVHMTYVVCWLWALGVMALEIMGYFSISSGARYSRKEPSFLDTLRASLTRYFDYRFICVLTEVSVVFIYVLFTDEMLTASDAPQAQIAGGGFWHAHAEFFVSLVFIVGIVGMVFAVHAKRRADEVFDLSSQIHRNLTSFFSSFDKVMDEDMERSVPNLIRNARKSLTFFVGPPLTGYFRDPDIGLKFRNLITSKAQQRRHSDFKIRYLCWKEEKCEAFFASLTDEQKRNFRDYRNSMYSEIKQLCAKSELFHYRHEDPLIRFVIADEEEAIFWGIEDPTPQGADKERKEHGAVGSYPGAGFTTDNVAMVRLLNAIFDNTLKDSITEPPAAHS
jgi:hypothetical protein